ncbi:RING/U-box [Glarea lozoyensis ATCC 20868]|uniref:RING/U-box n=1 Tax=Glarea lozoyensis (strain ATCC 20868 / MF5171) TaxID=1116229 RepID=S3D9Q9_GLAL2|nr:RING/U-box [Glarea lozoyensis ATCC 20868]EPE33859.1 RING/U-box [Glarea lozoyensis ATCC 20868]
MCQRKRQRGYIFADEIDQTRDFNLPAIVNGLNNINVPSTTEPPRFQTQSTSDDAAHQLQPTIWLPETCPSDEYCQLLDDKGNRLENCSKPARPPLKRGQRYPCFVDVPRKRKTMRKFASAGVTESGTPPREICCRERSSEHHAQSCVGSNDLGDHNKEPQSTKFTINLEKPSLSQDPTDATCATQQDAEMLDCWSDLRSQEQEVPPEEQCPVCLEDYELKIRLIPCGHTMCLECFSAWMAHRVSLGHDCSCPVCRTTIQGVNYS